jgi:hypothetical protein
MHKEDWDKYLSENLVGACTPAADWVKKTESPSDAWDKCENGTWMLWFIFSNAGDDKEKRRAVIQTLLPVIKGARPLVVGTPAVEAYDQTVSAIEVWCLDGSETPVKNSLDLIARNKRQLSAGSPAWNIMDSLQKICVAPFYTGSNSVNLLALALTGAMKATEASHGNASGVEKKLADAIRQPLRSYVMNQTKV